MNKYLKQFKNGILDQNPTFLQFLGMCPTLATTTSVTNALGMGAATTAVLACSNVIISLLRKFIPKQIRIASYIVIISGFVTAIELLMKAYFTPLYESLGIYIPLIVVNCIILARAEAFAAKNTPIPSLVDGLSMGIGFTLSLSLIASVREVLGNGTWLGLSVFGQAYHPATIFILPAGAFLTLGILSALLNWIRAYLEKHPLPQKAVIAADADENNACDESTENSERSTNETTDEAPADQVQPQAVPADVESASDDTQVTENKENNNSPENPMTDGEGDAADE